MTRIGSHDKDWVSRYELGLTVTEFFSREGHSQGHRHEHSHRQGHRQGQSKGHRQAHKHGIGIMQEPQATHSEVIRNASAGARYG